MPQDGSVNGAAPTDAAIHRPPRESSRKKVSIRAVSKIGTHSRPLGSKGNPLDDVYINATSIKRQKKARAHTATLKLPLRVRSGRQEEEEGKRRRDSPTEAHRARTHAERALL